MAYRAFEELEVHKEVCRDYGQKDRTTCAAGGIPSNIADGAEHDSSSEFIRFLHIAKGSATELRTQVYFPAKLNTKLKAESSKGI